MAAEENQEAIDEETAQEQNDIVSLSEFRRADRQAAFTRVPVPGYRVQGIPVISESGGQIFAYVFESGTQGNLYGSPFPMDDQTRENLGLPEEVQEVVNEVLEQPFSWPAALA